MAEFYVATADLGREVAGVKNPGLGRAVKLTESQALHALRLGHLSRTPPAPSNVAKKKKRGSRSRQAG